MLLNLHLENKKVEQVFCGLRTQCKLKTLGLGIQHTLFGSDNTHAIAHRESIVSSGAEEGREAAFGELQPAIW